MSIIPKGQPITLDAEYCEESCLVISNRLPCGDILEDELFEGDASEWSIIGSATKLSEDPYVIRGDSTTFALSQNITLSEGYKYLIKYAYRRSGTWGTNDTLDLSAWGDGVVNLPEASTELRIQGEYEYIPSSSAIGNFIFNFNNNTINREATILYIKIVPVPGSKEDLDCPEFSFSVIPPFNTPILETDIDFDLDFQDNLPSLSASLTNASPFTDNQNVFPSMGTITETGNHWVTYRSFNVFLFCKNSDDEEFKANYQVNGTNYDDLVLSVGSNELSTPISFNALDAVSTTVFAKSIDTVSPSEIFYNVGLIESAVIQMFKEQVVSLFFGYWNLEFNLEKTSGVTVKIYNPSSTLIFQSSTTDIKFNKTFKVETAGNHTIRFEVDDFVYDAGTDFDLVGNGVLTNLKVKNQCTISSQIETASGVFVASTDEEYQSQSETVGLSYLQSVNIGFKLGTLDIGQYRFLVNSSCNIYKNNYSNCFSICSNQNDLKNIRFENTINVGGNELEYNFCVWLKAAFVEPIIEDTREVYEYSNGLISANYVSNRSIETLLIYPIPKYLRELISVGLTGSIFIDNVEYQKIKDEDISNVVSYSEESPIRISLHKVGDFTRTIN